MSKNSIDQKYFKIQMCISLPRTKLVFDPVSPFALLRDPTYKSVLYDFLFLFL